MKYILQEIKWNNGLTGEQNLSDEQTNKMWFLYMKMEQQMALEIKLRTRMRLC